MTRPEHHEQRDGDQTPQSSGGDLQLAVELWGLILDSNLHLVEKLNQKLHLMQD